MVNLIFQYRFSTGRIQDEMNGEAAYDYVRLSELDTQKNALEERLLEIYEEIGV